MFPKTKVGQFECDNSPFLNGCQSLREAISEKSVYYLTEEEGGGRSDVIYPQRESAGHGLELVLRPCATNF